MKIQTSEIKMQSSHNLLESRNSSESLTVWQEKNDSPAPVVLELSQKAKNLMAAAPQSLNQEETEELSLSDEDKMMIKLIESFIKNLTGKEVKLKVPNLKLKIHNSPNTSPQGRLGGGVIYTAHEEVYEKENLNFSALGRIITEDGREISFDLELNISREFYSRTDFSLRMGDAAKIDPLVINYGGGAPRLSTTKFTFDLDCDGSEEQISFLLGGSGFLALDKNNDNTINDGSELFGPLSGNGFADLARFDEDGNNWIDENDPIFSRLRIWTKDEEGRDKLLVLGQVGIGAIYLGHLETPFALKDGSQLLGEVRASGIFLLEDGTAGTVQHIDLAI